MAGVNKVILVGRLGKDPEVRYTPSGAAVANFSIATSEEWKDKDTGNEQERTEGFRVEASNPFSAGGGEYLHKGSQIYIEGRLQTRAWDDRDGNKRYTTEIVAQTMQMLGSADRGGRTAPMDENFPVEEPVTVPGDDIPF